MMSKPFTRNMKTQLRHALTIRWMFLMHTVPSTDLLLQPLEEAIWHQFLLAVTGRHGITNLERDLLALPVRHGGLGVLVPTRNANNQFKACKEVTAPLVELIRQRNPQLPQALTAKAEANEVCTSHKEPKRNHQRGRVTEAQIIRGWAKGLHKQAFRDALCLRFGWTPTRLAMYCPCGQQLSVSHAFSCPKGAMPSI